MAQPFDTSILDARLRQERAQNEFERQRILAAGLLWLSQNGQQFGFETGYLFGSVTQPGRFTQGSDVDIAVESINQGQPFALAANLSMHLNREVDIVPLDQCHFAEKIRRLGLVWTATNSAV